ncbi:Translation initiation factor 3 subunit c [Trichoderma virens FT-333]|nr:Translation initiation factor 3 subunit c [Trichoderma virens FT-333]
MSRFFRSGGDDSSSESSSDEEELYSGEEDQELDQEQSEEESDEFDHSDEESEDDDKEAGGDQKQGAFRFLRDNVASDSEGSDDEVRDKVKSAQVKRLDELETSIKQIENGQKNGDWTLISTEFDKLNRQVTKLPAGSRIPKPYIKVIAEIEESVNEALAKAKVTPKKMNATQARALNAVKQKVKKTNKDYQDEIAVYREDKDTYLWSSDEEEEVPQPKAPKAVKFDETAGADEAADEGFATVGKGGRTLQYTPESIFKHLRGIMETRGKKNTDRLEQIKVMERLNEIANTPTSRFHWKAAEKELSQLLTILSQTSEYVVLENKHIKVAGSIVSYVERLDDELHRSLQSIDPHTSEYIERLQDEGALYNVIFRGLLYYEALKKDETIEVPQDSVNRIVMRRLEHVYFKPAQVVKTFEENSWKAVGENVDSTTTPRAQAQDPTSLVNVLCAYLYANSEGILRARALLSQVYFLALHDDYYKARDMMLMSHLQETVTGFDIQSQILYNRTLVQVGLCAFRKGLIYDAQNTLQEICGSGRQKELLAQGVMMQRYSQVSPEQERLEKQRQLPFHMHINLELLECVYLTCSMLLEIPLLAQTGSSPDVKKRVISKTYRRMLEYHERQIFTGPPENTRDHVMQASKALAAGEWKKSITYIHSIKIWDLMPNTDEIKEMLSKQIQEEGLRTYLFTYAPFYDTLAIDTLSSMFELDSTKVAAVISKMISHEELAASLDQVTNNVIFRKGVELSRLQSLALALSDKASALIETNERTLEQRTQGTSSAFERQGGRGRGGHRGGARGGRGGPRGGGNPQRQAGGTQFTGGALGAAVRG